MWLFDNLNLFGRQFRPMMGMWFADGDGAGGDDKGGDDKGGDDKGAAGKYYDGFSEEVRNHPSVTKFENAEAQAVSYINLEKKISSKGILVPGDKATPEEISTYHKALGRPDTAEEYTLTPAEGAHKESALGEEVDKGFRAEAHRLGLTAKQTADLYGWYTGTLSNGLNQRDELALTKQDEAVNKLRGSWGLGYDTKVDLAKRVMSKFADEETQALLKDPKNPIGNNPHLIKMMADIGGKLSEDSLGDLGGSRFGGMTPQEAQAKITQIRSDSKSAYNDANHPMHAEAVSELTSLTEISLALNKAGV